MKYFEAPSEWDNDEENWSLFLAGGITGCPDWQRDLTMRLFTANANLTIVNPRRQTWPMGDPTAAREQIEWEYKSLTLCDLISFWFPAETDCHITLFELGRWSSLTDKSNLFVGVHPEYKRRADVEIQMELVQPYLVIAYSIEDLAQQILSAI